MICRQLNDGPCKTYLLVSTATRETVLVDPLLERADGYLETLRREGLRLRLLLDTHTHADHLSGCAALRDKTGAPYLMHRCTPVSGVDQRLEDGETVGVGDLRMSFLHTPGHTADSLTVVLEDRILTGDFLLIGAPGAGRLDLPGSDPSSHFDSLKRLDALPDALALHPAHDDQGRTHSSLGRERGSNPLLQPRTREAYLRWWREKNPGPADWMEDMVRANIACARDPEAARVPKGWAACARAAGPAQVEANLPHVSPAVLAAELRRPSGSLLLLDVRTWEEYDGELGHIPGAALIPVDELQDRLSEVPVGADIVCVCRSGKRAARAAGILRAADRRKVRVLAGGMLAWNAARPPVTPSWSSPRRIS